jgi:hypothetical protein
MPVIMKTFAKKAAVYMISAAVAALVLGSSQAYAAGGTQYGPYGPYGPHVPEETGFADQGLLTTIGLGLYAGGIAIVAYSTIIKKKIASLIG